MSGITFASLSRARVDVLVTLSTLVRVVCVDPITESDNIKR